MCRGRSGTLHLYFPQARGCGPASMGLGRARDAGLRRGPRRGRTQRRDVRKRQSQGCVALPGHGETWAGDPRGWLPGAAQGLQGIASSTLLAACSCRLARGCRDGACDSLVLHLSPDSMETDTWLSACSWSRDRACRPLDPPAPATGASRSYLLRDIVTALGGAPQVRFSRDDCSVTVLLPLPPSGPAGLCCRATVPYPSYVCWCVFAFLPPLGSLSRPSGSCTAFVSCVTAQGRGLASWFIVPFLPCCVVTAAPPGLPCHL